MADFDKGFLSVRFRHPSGKGEFEVQISSKYADVDAVFISVDAVEKILVPFYAKKDRRDAEQLQREVMEQQKGGVCIVLHRFSCGRIVPPIDWNGSSARV